MAFHVRENKMSAVHVVALTALTKRTTPYVDALREQKVLRIPHTYHHLYAFDCTSSFLAVFAVSLSISPFRPRRTHDPPSTRRNA